MEQESKNFAAEPNTGNDVDLASQAHVENVVVKPNQALNLQSDTAVDDKKEKVTAKSIDGAPTGSSDQQSVGPEEKKDGKKATKKTKPAPDYSLNYSDEQKKELERVTRVGDAEIKRVREDPRFPTIPFGDNTMINLKGAALNGVSFKTPEVNRKHGKDEASTGESLMKYGPQHPLIVITDKMA